MRLEDTIQRRLFRGYISDYTYNDAGNFVIECKAEQGKPIPLCMPDNILERNDIAFRRLHLCGHCVTYERSTPRALYNLAFSNYLSEPLVKLRIKDVNYYYAPGVLFSEDKEPLFYFAREFFGNTGRPRLYISPRLLVNAATQGKPMEKFFMSTIVPYLVEHDINSYPGLSRTIIEVGYHIDDTFFIPNSTLITSVTADRINMTLNDILAENADVISNFMDNYRQ